MIMVRNLLQVGEMLKMECETLYIRVKKKKKKVSHTGSCVEVLELRF